MDTGPLTDRTFMTEARRLIDAGREQGIGLRLLGSLAIRLHSGALWEEIEGRMSRPLTDIDFAAYGRFSSRTPELFADLGYDPDPAVLRHHGGQRQVFWSRLEPRLHCDVFFDKLSFCHTVNLKGRLDGEDTTISVSDLFLEKTQIVEINEKDLKDLAVLLCAHELADTEGDVLNVAYLVDILRRDWGFWYTVTTNLERLRQFVEESRLLDESRSELVVQRAADVSRALQDASKTSAWKMRSVVGTKKRWYQPVEEVDRG